MVWFSFVDTRFDTHNVYNLMAAIKNNENENSYEITSTPSIAYQVCDFCDTSTAFNFFVTQLLVTGFLKSSYNLVCDNA